MLLEPLTKACCPQTSATMRMHRPVHKQYSAMTKQIAGLLLRRSRWLLTHVEGSMQPASVTGSRGRWAPMPAPGSTADLGLPFKGRLMSCIVACAAPDQVCCRFAAWPLPGIAPLLAICAVSLEASSCPGFSLVLLKQPGSAALATSVTMPLVLIVSKHKEFAEQGCLRAFNVMGQTVPFRMCRRCSCVSCQRQCCTTLQLLT